MTIIKIKKYIPFIILSFLFNIQFAFSQQKQKPILEGSASLDFALYDGLPSLGLGAHLKLLRPTKNSDNFFVAGFDVDILSDIEAFGDDLDLIFMLASFGYRKQIKSFFIEPKIGGGLFNGYRYNSPCIFIGVEPGIQKEKINFSIDCRYFASDGIVYGDHFSTVSFKIGYKIH